jgi:hypothetical protein
MRKKYEENFFFASLKVKISEERSRIRSCPDPEPDPDPEVEVRIRGSGAGSAPKCHGSPTLVLTISSGNEQLACTTVITFIIINECLRGCWA